MQVNPTLLTNLLLQSESIHFRQHFLAHNELFISKRLHKKIKTSSPLPPRKGNEKILAGLNSPELEIWVQWGTWIQFQGGSQVPHKKIRTLTTSSLETEVVGIVNILNTILHFATTTPFRSWSSFEENHLFYSGRMRFLCLLIMVLCAVHSGDHPRKASIHIYTIYVVFQAPHKCQLMRKHLLWLVFCEAWADKRNLKASGGEQYVHGSLLNRYMEWTDVGAAQRLN